MRPPPLIEPGADLDASEVRRYARHLLLPEIGRVGQRRLKAARVLVVGAGGLGSPAVQYLAAAGVGTLGIVDDDVVEVSNLQRQVLHTTADLGAAKVDSAARAVAALNPLVRVETLGVRLGPDNVAELVAAYDLVLDGSDNFATRYLVDDACRAQGRPLVWGAVLAGAGQVSVAWEGHGPVYRDVFPAAPPAGTVPSCAEAGVLGATVATIGSLMAGEAVKVLTGAGELLLGRVLLLDSFAGTVRTIGVGRSPRREAVAAQADAVPEITAEELPVRSDLTLVDVREDIEVEVDGGLAGAVRVPAGAIESGTALPPGRLVLVCAGGARSAATWRGLSTADQERSVSLHGGIRALRVAAAGAGGEAVGGGAG